MKRRISHDTGRRGFTLIEMLVVVTLILVLAGLTVAFLANFRGSAASQATTQLYGWLNMAKQRAIRDRNPYGIRLVPGGSNPLLIDQLQYIEQPEDFYIPGGTFTDICPGGTNDKLYILQGFYPTTVSVPYYLAQFSRAPVSVDFTGGFQKDPTLWPVQPGDYLEVNGSGKVHRIASKAMGDQVDGVNYNGKNPVVGNIMGLVLVSPPDAPVSASPTGTWQYRVIRRPRVAGEDALRLPQGVVINLGQTGPTYTPAQIGATGFDILFGPKGTVIGPAAAYDKIVLWIHETAASSPADPTYDPNLIVINTRSGAIAAYRVDTNPGADPYSETRTGQTSP